MNLFIPLSVIGLWLVYSLIIKLTKKRKYDYTYIVAFVFLFTFAYLYVFDDVNSTLFTLYSYVTCAVFAVWIIIDNSILLFKKNVSEFDFHSLEQEIEYISNASELVRQRFISTIELLHDGISFREGDIFFGSDRFIEIFGMKDNEFTLSEFENCMVKEDLVQYNMTLEKLSKKYPTYTIKYRVKSSDKIEWVIEHGKMIKIGKKTSYISIIKRMDLKLYPETDVDVLNNLQNDKELFEEMQSLHRKKTPYHLVIIQLTNIPKINEKYGRDFGDLMMGEYLSKLRFKFIKDSRSLFRISGIKFGLIIKDKAKFDLLDRALVGSGELFTMQLKFGGVTQTIYPNLGITEAPYEGKNADMVYREAEQALSITLKEESTTSFHFYNRK